MQSVSCPLRVFRSFKAKMFNEFFWKVAWLYRDACLVSEFITLFLSMLLIFADRPRQSATTRFTQLTEPFEHRLLRPHVRTRWAHVQGVRNYNEGLWWSHGRCAACELVAVSKIRSYHQAKIHREFSLCLRLQTDFRLCTFTQSLMGKCKWSTCSYLNNLCDTLAIGHTPQD